MNFEVHAAAGLARRSMELAVEWLNAIERQTPASRPLMQAEDMTGVLQHVAAFVADESYPLTQQPDVAAPLRHYATVRREDGYGPAQLLHDMDVLAGMLDRTAVDMMQTCEVAMHPHEVARVTVRLQRASLFLGTVAVDAFWRAESLQGVPTRLRQFADAVAFELNTPLNAAAVTAQLLEYAGADMRSSEARRLAVLIQRNVARAEAVLQSIRECALAPRDSNAGFAITRDALQPNDV